LAVKVLHNHILQKPYIQIKTQLHHYSPCDEIFETKLHLDDDYFVVHFLNAEHFFGSDGFDYTCDPVSLLVWAFAPAQFGSLTGWVGVDCKKAMK